jgi:hypothetical protein
MPASFRTLEEMMVKWSAVRLEQARLQSLSGVRDRLLHVAAFYVKRKQGFEKCGNRVQQPGKACRGSGDRVSKEGNLHGREVEEEK